MIDLSCKYIGLQLKNPVVVGSSGLTLFNRPYNPDIDIEHLQINASNMLSTDTEYSHSLRWVALLAGADAVHMVSVFYKHHFDVLPQIINGLESWMLHHNFNSISDFKGLLSRKNVHNPASYERVQFLRLFSSIE